MGKPRQTQIASIDDPQKRRVVFSKRRPTLFKKAGELAVLTDSDVSVRVRSSTGRTYYRSYQRGKPIISKNTRRKGSRVNSSTGPKEWEEGLVKQECDACMAKKDLQSVIANYEACLAYARERLGNWENNPSVKASDSGVKVDRETEEMTDEGIDSIFKSSGHVDCKSFWTSPLKRTAGGASDPTSSGRDDWEFNTDDPFHPENSAIGGPSDPMSSGLDDGEFNMDELPNFSGPCIGDGHCPENLAIGGRSNPTSSDLDDCEFSVDDLFDLAESCIRNGDRLENSAIGGPSNPTSSGLDDWELNTDDDLFRSENSAIGGPSDPTSSGLDDGQFNPDAFLDLPENYIGNGDVQENSAFGGGYNPNDFAGLEDFGGLPDINDI